MDRLPQEIYNEIATHVWEARTENVAGIATVSRKWQLAIERHICRYIDITNHEIDQFNSYFATRHRRRFLRTLVYDVELPAYNYFQVRCRYECEQDRRTNDEAFTTAMQKLFEALSIWDPAIDSWLTLRINDLASPSDAEPAEYTDEDSSDPRIASFIINDLSEQCHVYSYVQLLPSANLPLVPVLESLKMSQLSRNVAHSVPFQLAAKLPNLREASFCVDDMEDRYPLLRGQNRAAMTNWIENAIPNATELRQFHLNVYRHDDSYAARLPNGMADRLCRAIRESTAELPHLKSLTMEGTIDKSLFWPEPSQTLVPPFWQHLEILEVNFYASRSSNGWYFKGLRTSRQVLDDTSELISASEQLPPGYGDQGDPPSPIDDDLDFHRFLEYAMPECTDTPTPDDCLIDPLLESFAKACAQMPNLKKAHLATSIVVKDRPPEIYNACQADWGVWYTAPGQKLNPSSRGVCSIVQGSSPHRRLIWDIGDWRPSKTVRRLFKTIGLGEHGGIMFERFVDSWNAVLKPRLIEAARRETFEFLGRNFVDDDYMEFLAEQNWDPDDPYFLELLDEDMDLYEMEASAWGMTMEDLMDDDLQDQLWDGFMEFE